MKLRRFLSVIIPLMGTFLAVAQNKDLINLSPTTSCNPVNLSYRFCLD